MTAWLTGFHLYFSGLVQERCNSSALAMELRLSCIKPSICCCYRAQEPKKVIDAPELPTLRSVTFVFHGHICFTCMMFLTECGTLRKKKTTSWTWRDSRATMRASSSHVSAFPQTKVTLDVSRLEEKWPTFCKQHFPKQFLGRKFLYWDENYWDENSQ